MKFLQGSAVPKAFFNYLFLNKKLYLKMERIWMYLSSYIFYSYFCWSACTFNTILFVFVDNRFFVHTMHPDQFPLTLLLPCPSPSSTLTQIHYPSVCFQNRTGLQEMTSKHHKTKYNKALILRLEKATQ